MIEKKKKQKKKKNCDRNRNRNRDNDSNGDNNNSHVNDDDNTNDDDNNNNNSSNDSVSENDNHTSNSDDSVNHENTDRRLKSKQKYLKVNGKEKKKLKKSSKKKKKQKNKKSDTNKINKNRPHHHGHHSNSSNNSNSTGHKYNLEPHKADYFQSTIGQRQIDTLKVYCVYGKANHSNCNDQSTLYTSEYCDWQGPLKELDQHLNICQVHQKVEALTKQEMLLLFYQHYHAMAANIFHEKKDNNTEKKYVIEPSTTELSCDNKISDGEIQVPSSFNYQICDEFPQSREKENMEDFTSINMITFRVIFQEKELTIALPKSELKISSLQGVVIERFGCANIKPHQLTFEVKNKDGYQEKLHKDMLHFINCDSDIIYAMISNKIRVILNIEKKKVKCIITTNTTYDEFKKKIQAQLPQNNNESFIIKIEKGINHDQFIQNDEHMKWLNTGEKIIEISITFCNETDVV